MTPQGQQKIYIGLYIGVLLAGCLLTFLLYRVGNRIADARIAEAKADAARAMDSAAHANERAQKLENDNLVLRERVVTLEKEAAMALQRTLVRNLNDSAFIFALKHKPKAQIQIAFSPADDESYNFSYDVRESFAKAGWHAISCRHTETDSMTTDWLRTSHVSLNPTLAGEIILASNRTMVASVSAIVAAFEEAGIKSPVRVKEESNVPNGTIRIFLVPKLNSAGSR